MSRPDEMRTFVKPEPSQPRPVPTPADFGLRLKPEATIVLYEPHRIGLMSMVRVVLNAPAEQGMIVDEFKFQRDSSRAWRKAHTCAGQVGRILRAAGIEVKLVAEAQVER